MRQEVRQKIEPGREGRMKPKATPLTFGVRPTLKWAKTQANKRAREDSNL
jgi:hypothetical protein